MSKAEGHIISQAAFGKMVGASAETIKSVELGRLALSRPLLLRIWGATMAAPSSLERKRGPALNSHGKPYTVKDYQNAKRVAIGELTEMMRTQWEASCLGDLYALLKAAQLPHKRRCWAVVNSFHEWFQNALKDFDLEKEAKEVAHEITKESKIAAILMAVACKAEDSKYTEWLSDLAAVFVVKGHVPEFDED